MRASKRLIIAAIAANKYVSMAVNAGYQVICIDAFADLDTQQLAHEWYQIAVHNSQFDANAMLDLLDSLDLSEIEGFCFGAGFEQQPDLLKSIAERLPLLGNHADVIKACKQPIDFYEVCLSLNVPAPRVSLTPPEHKGGWLQKQMGGCGGTHVQDWHPCFKVANNSIYYQRKVAGQQYSALLIAQNRRAQVLGFNQQWLSPTLAMPYRLGGVVSQITLQNNIQKKLIEYIKKLTYYFNLKGLNSIDFVCNEDDLWVLEINPRLSASACLYELTQGHLIDVHVALCQDADWAQVIESVRLNQVSKAFQTIYAVEDLQIDATITWPNWVSDIPHEKRLISQDQPVITVNAAAKSVTATCDLIAKRTAIINKQLNMMVMKWLK